MKRILFFLLMLYSVGAAASAGPSLTFRNNTPCTLYVRATAGNITGCTSAYNTQWTQILPGASFTWYGGQGMPVPWVTTPVPVVRFLSVTVSNNPACGYGPGGGGCTGDMVTLNVPCTTPGNANGCMVINNNCAGGGCPPGSIVNADLSLGSFGASVYDVRVDLTP